MLFGENNPKIAPMITAWSDFLASQKDWKKLIEKSTPIENGCGVLYELPNQLKRENESFAIADMRKIKFVEPHFHAFGLWEVHVVLQGNGKVIVGEHIFETHKGDTIIIPPDTAYYAIPDQEYVVACLNTPIFRPDSYIVLTGDDPEKGFDLKQFEGLTQNLQ